MKHSKDDKQKVEEINSYLETIHQWLEQVKFKKTFIGGLAEEDVWKKIEELNSLYEQALTAERIRYNSLLEEHKADLKQQE